MDLASVQSVLKSSPNDPVLVFDALGLPITYIDDLEIERNGRNRVFKFRGKNLFSPEIVAVVYYESQGHIASWNEGLAFWIVQNAFERALTLPLFDQLEYVGVKPEAILATPVFNEDEDRVITRSERLASIDQSDLHLRKPNIEDVERKHQREKETIQERMRFPIGVSRLLDKQHGWIRFLTESFVSLRLKCTAEELVNQFVQNIELIRSNKDLLRRELSLPEKTGDKTNHWEKFINEWTLKFAQQMIDECDFDYLLNELFKYSRLSPRWDLVLIDKDSKKLRYVEVKLDDGFTQAQISELPQHLMDGGSLELCKIRPKKSV